MRTSCGWSRVSDSPRPDRSAEAPAKVAPFVAGQSDDSVEDGGVGKMSEVGQPVDRDGAREMLQRQRSRPLVEPAECLGGRRAANLAAEGRRARRRRLPSGPGGDDRV